ncbi:uncharacterized protein BDR25DRAFT_338786 [Lindgomyces ingoldianus]|uniref:Uncharacterized protein n=1 Tax=Lindgomyces ingoldianus TaxID=673940 RepID=A0ACB6RFK9_9PLEO|nr:uncharacterized protein BDR25DRAFT_338786 [Lindgomyces ingoldianus]KAF2478129.1 hypothetical protein BDR25DRAFT_338786 [Lindgomyces ingoldianus]
MGSFSSRILPKWTLNKPSGDSNRPHPNEDVTLRNAHESHLHQLPAELIFMIDSYLRDISRHGPNVSKMALRATCRRFHTILPAGPHPNAPWGELDRRSYSQLISLARFRDLCERERGGLLNPNHLVCCICRRSRESWCFTPVEQKKDPEQRTCIGAQGVLEICPHLRLTYMGFRLGPIEISCNRKHYSIEGFEGTVKVSQIGEIPNREIKVEVELILLEIYKGQELTREKVLDAVKKSNWKICPHMHTYGAEIWLSLFAEYLQGHGKLFSGKKLCSVRCGFGRWCWENGRLWPLHKCGVLDCDTRVVLFKDRRKSRKNVNREFLVMRIDRYLGKMESADDRRWMSQIEEASKLDEDRFRDSMRH